MDTTSDLFQVQPADYSAHGKFLLTGEYAVLDNVDALAIPLKLDQHLKILPQENPIIEWTSYDMDGSVWFSDYFELGDFHQNSFQFDDQIAAKLFQILKTGLRLANHSGFANGFKAATQLDFDRKSGMGTSSTLISMVADWLGCDAYELQFECFGGSGYDIASARANSPIIYNYNDGKPKARPISFKPEFTGQLFFVYLNEKQDSRQSIANFDPEKLERKTRNLLNEMPKRFLETENDLESFESVISEHEEIIARLIDSVPVKKRLFPDYKGAIKSLGGWGGDYILVTGSYLDMTYFRDKGYKHIHNWNDVVLSHY